MHVISIVQGRLSPPEGDRLQFFPKNWEAEFPLAKEMGFSGIVWTLDHDIESFDPVRDIWAQPEMLSRIDKARAILPISSIDCNLYPMFGPGIERTLADFNILLPALAPRLAHHIVVIPLLLKTHAPKTEAQKKEAQETLKKIVAVAAPLGLRIALETEMPPPELAEFVDSCNSPAVGVCYDIGNCTSYGFACPADIRALGDRIIDVHLKDRAVGSEKSVQLGAGDADFTACFEALKEIGYRGAYTLQAWRGKDYRTNATDQLNFIVKKLDTTYEP